ncbi:MAG: hypothetical protein SVK54_05640 [candidate division WOR-3 bacterium]|nr:hypothetical protein [candidate division WOR-3 bacterium]
MKSQDILIALKIIERDSEDWRIIDIAYNLKISQSEVHEGINRLHDSEIMHRRKHIVKNNLAEFIIHGLKYCFPAIPGMKSRGIPTSHSSEFLSNIVRDKDQDTVVWPYENGKSSGVSIPPLYSSVPYFVLENPFMYEYLCYIDAIRIGRKREREYAKKKISQLLK